MAHPEKIHRDAGWERGLTAEHIELKSAAELAAERLNRIQ